MFPGSRFLAAVTCRVCRGSAAALAVLLMTASAVGGSWASPMEVSVLSSAPERIVVHYELRDFTQGAVVINGQRYATVFLPGEAQLLLAGAPDLPHFCRSVIVPDDGVMAVNVLESSCYEIANIDIAPSKGNLLRTIDPDDVPYEFGDEYRTDAFYPGELAALHEPFIIRDHRGVTVDIFPFQYNPVRRTLRVYTTLTVEVVRVGPGGSNVLVRDYERDLNLAFHQVYQSRFLNYEPDIDYPPVGETGDMLIICYDQWIANVEPLAVHKSSIGINTTVKGVSTIPGGSTASAIKSYIQSVYNTSDLAFVLLVGDGEEVATPSASGGSSDPTYSKLAGSDNWPDIIVGRFSAQTAAQVDTQVERTIEYETMPATQQPWFKRGTGVASNQGAGKGDEGQADHVHMAEIRTWLLGYGYPHVDEIYDPNATAAMVTDALNAGRGIVNYCGHGSSTSWGTTGFSSSKVNSLINDNMLPFIVSVACVNGKFADRTCFAETWLRATHNGEPTGAVGAYMSSISQSWAPPMEAQDEFNLLLVAQAYHSFGALCYNGSCSMMEQYGSAGVKMFNTWHIFGDPSLRVLGSSEGMRVTPTGGLQAQGEPGGPFTPGSIDYIVENRDPTPIEYRVTRTRPWVSLTNPTRTLAAGATAIVTVSINPNANSLGKGRYADEVLFENLTNHRGDTSREVSLRVGASTMQHQWNLDTNPGWPISGGEWAFGEPTGRGGGAHGYPDPTSGATGTNVYGVNLNGNYSTSVGGPYHVTLGPVDLSDVLDVSLRFMRWLNTDEQPFAHATVEVSNNSSEWVEVWSNGGNKVTENAWSSQQYDVSAVAANQPAVYIRWGYQIGSFAWVYSGWNIDDIEIWGLAVAPQVPGDLNCDSVVDFDDVDPFVLALSGQAAYYAVWPNCNWLNADCNGDGTVNFDDIDPFMALLGG